MKPKAKLSNVSKQDVRHALSDLHYTAIVTLPVIDAALLCLGLLDVYDANLALPSRRNGQKLYVRAASNFSTKQYADFVNADIDLALELETRLADLSAVKNGSHSKKVTFKSFRMARGILWLPLDCIIGSIVPRTNGKLSREWHITAPELLSTFYSVPSRGGFYFLRELINQSESKEQSDGNI